MLFLKISQNLQKYTCARVSLKLSRTTILWNTCEQLLLDKSSEKFQIERWDRPRKRLGVVYMAISFSGVLVTPKIEIFLVIQFVVIIALYHSFVLPLTYFYFKWRISLNEKLCHKKKIVKFLHANNIHFWLVNTWSMPNYITCMRYNSLKALLSVHWVSW